MNRWAGARATATLLATYGAAAVALTWPLARDAGERLPDTWLGCRFDTLHVAWVLSHQALAWTTDPRALPDANIYHPATGALFLTEAGFGALPYFLPAFLLTGNPALATNLVLLAGIALTAAALHLVVHRWTASHAAAFVAASTFLATRWVAWTWLPVAPNYAVLHYLPFIVYLAAALDTWRAAALLALLVVLQSTASVYVAAAVLAPLACLLALRIALRRGGAARLASALALALLALGAAYAGHAGVRLGEPGIRRQSVWAPHAATPSALPGDLLRADAATAVPTVALGLIALGAFLRSRRGAALERSRAWRHAALWTGVGVLASMTPWVRLGEHVVPMPQAILASATPIYELVRFPGRLGVAALIGLAMLAGLAFAELERAPGRFHRAALAVLLAALMHAQYRTGIQVPGLVAHRSLPRSYPLWTPPGIDDPLGRLIARGRGPILELPIGPVDGAGSANDAPLQARAAYRSIFHRRPVLNGYASYWPRGFDERMKLARRLPDAGALSELRRATGLDSILVHTRLIGAVEREICRALARRGMAGLDCARDFGAASRAAWLAAARQGRGDLRLTARNGGDLLFEVRDLAPAPPTVGFSDKCTGFPTVALISQ